ncbi:class II glutamine amidotransferase [Lujinxingia litoralis]|uniref:Class II glutamine amidotransferase n=1 Tax=Lujinxingia litoralis TaxID=2211119 RepID=A0A328CDE0_9DELT|nr:class II glutamine amidotransferase [Lujinxingia litoralis]RAL24959.1 class II glutamine amidotransferase [Lujinxingia litoralis]
MCRLFGFRSVITSQVHRSLISADNALMRQSERHPDGWGVAYYVAGVPHVVKSVNSAVSDSLFQRVSGVVASETVVAHLRKATVGNLSILNSHPFQYGSWVLAHNGQIPDFARYREAVIARVSPVFRRFILGDTDSEVIFYLLLSKMAQRFDVHRKGAPLAELSAALRETVEAIQEVTGLDCYTRAKEQEFYLSLLVTNGHVMVAHQGGKELFYSTHKTACPDREICPSYAPCCEARSRSGFVNHFIVSSEPLQGENIWEAMKPGEILGVDWRMQLYQEMRDASPAPVGA